jgi:hypothetical protein
MRGLPLLVMAVDVVRLWAGQSAISKSTRRFDTLKTRWEKKWPIWMHREKYYRERTEWIGNQEITYDEGGFDTLDEAKQGKRNEILKGVSRTGGELPPGWKCSGLWTNEPDC